MGENKAEGDRSDVPRTGSSDASGRRVVTAMLASATWVLRAVVLRPNFGWEVPRKPVRLGLVVGSFLCLGGFLLPSAVLLAIGDIQCALGLLLYSKTTKKFLIAWSSLVVGVAVGAAFALRLGLPLSNTALTYQKAFVEFAAGAFLSWTV